MLFIGIDPGMINLGFFALAGRSKLGKHMSFDTQYKDSVIGDYARSRLIELAIQQKVDLALSSSKHVKALNRKVKGKSVLFVCAVEGPSQNSRMGKRTQVGFLHQGIYAGLSHFEGALIYVVPPTTLKRFVTGKGNANKTLMLTKIVKRYNPESFADHNVYEACAIAHLGKFAYWKYPIPTKKQLGVETFQVQYGQYVRLEP